MELFGELDGSISSETLGTEASTLWEEGKQQNWRPWALTTLLAERAPSRECGRVGGKCYVSEARGLNMFIVQGEGNWKVKKVEGMRKGE